MLSVGRRSVQGAHRTGTHSALKRMNNSTEGSERILQGGVEGPQKSGWRRDSGFKPGPVTDGKHLGIMERKRGLQPEKGRVESDPVQH